MDIRSKQKLKKRRTRKNLDDLRRRSRSEVNSNENLTSHNTLTFKSITKYNNEIMTCKPLTLFNKTITSKIVTRVPFSIINNTDNIINPHISKTKSSNISSCSHQYHNPLDSINKSSMCEDNNKIALGCPKFEELCNKNSFGISECEGSDSVNSYSPFYNIIDLKNSKQEEVSNYEHEYLSKSSNFNSETGTSHCFYEKFMNGLPGYLKEHFPTLNSRFLTNNITYLKQSLFKYNYQEKEKNTNNSTSNIVNIPTYHKELIQDPVDYIQTGWLWEQGVQKKQNVLLPNCSSLPLSGVGVNTLDMFLNSPQCQYFPHKLNQ